MKIRRLPAERPAVRRFVERLWLPYHRELETVVDAHALADGVDIAEAETEFRLELLDGDHHRTWIAVDDSVNDADADNADADDAGADGRGPDESPVCGPEDPLGDGPWVGFVTSDIDEAPSVFDRPDRARVGDIYVREAYRGTSLARRLVERVERYARETGCAELALTVDADNDRALAFYDSLGFERHRLDLLAPVDDG